MKGLANKLTAMAREISAGDEWSDEKTEAFAKEVAAVMKRDRDLSAVRVNGNRIDFVHAPDFLTSVPLVLTLKEFGYGGNSESVNGDIFSEEVRNFRIPGGFTMKRDPKELWKKAKDNLEDIIHRARG